MDTRRILKAQNRWEQARKIQVIQRFVIYARTSADEKNLDNYFGTFKTRGGKSEIKTHFLSRSKLKSLFDFFVVMINLYLAFKIPFRLAFVADNDVPLLYIHDLILDAILFIDILFRFFRPPKDDPSHIELSQKYQYLIPLVRFRFIPDLFSVLPLYMIHSKYYWFKIGRIFRVTSFLGWVKTSEIPQIFLKQYMLKHHYSSEIMFKIIQSSVLVAIICHCIACVWYIIPTQENVPMESTWIGPDWESYSTADRYMRSLYWTTVTFSSVGYGDITAKTIPEYIYSMFIEFLGIMFFAYLMGSVSTYLAKYSSKKDAVNIRENELSSWLIQLEDQIKDESFKNEASHKITRFFKQRWACDPTSISNFEDFYMMLPPDLALSLSEHLFGYRFALFSSFFENFPKDLRFSISSLFSSIIFRNHVEVIRGNTSNTNIYFIVSGSIGVGRVNSGYALNLPQGSYFGEDSAIFNDCSYLSFATCSECTMLSVEYSKLCKLFKKQKIDIMPFAKLSYKRAEYFIKVVDFKYSIDGGRNQYEIEEFIKSFDIISDELNIDEEEGFTERSKNMVSFNKENKVEPNKEILSKLSRETEGFSKQINDFQETYEKEIRKIISSLEDIKEGKSVKKVLRNLNKE